jgi:DNA-binding transcriptional MerR regulator
MKFSEQARNSAFSLISPVLEATGGLTLSQLSKLTGLEGTTIQNWIKRGWVSATKGKKYSEQQVIRILLINMLRGAMKLEDIAKLMAYINGDVEDTSDDIISDQLLYDILCRIIFNAEDDGTFSNTYIRKLVSNEVEEYKNEITDNEKMKKAMYVMVIAYRSGYLKSEMEKGLKDIFSE